MMLPLVYPLLANNSEVAGFVGDRIFRGAAPQGTPAPYVVWFLIDAAPQNTLDKGQARIDSCRIQVDCWSQSDDEAERVAKATRDAIGEEHDILSIDGPIQDPKTMRWRVSLDFTFWKAVC